MKLVPGLVYTVERVEGQPWKQVATLASETEISSLFWVSPGRPFLVPKRQLREGIYKIQPYFKGQEQGGFI